MTALLVSVADAIVTELGGLMLNDSFTANRSYADWDDLLSDAAEFQVDVVPVSFESEMIARGKHEFNCVVSVLLRKLFSHADRSSDNGRLINESIDLLLDDLQRIYEYFAPCQPAHDGRRLKNMPAARWKNAVGEGRSVIRAAYSRKFLREHNQFSGWLQLVYGVPREFP